MSKRQILKDASHYSVSSVIARLISLGRGILLARLLGPTTYGLWQALLLILNYGQLSHFGLRDAMTREAPIYRGRGDTKKIEEIYHTVFTSTVLIAIVLAMVLFVVSQSLTGTASDIMRAGIPIMAVIVLLHQIFQWYLCLMKAEKRFLLISKAMIIFSVLNIFFTILLLLYFQLYGALIGFSFAYIGVIVYLRLKLGNRIRLGIDVHELIRLAKMGMVLMALRIGYTFLKSIDKLVIISMLTATDLGYYGVAISISAFVYYIPSVSASVLFPRMLEEIGKNNDAKHIKKYIEKPIKTLFLGISLMIGALYLSTAPLIYYLLPKFIAGISASKLLVLGTAFMAMYDLPANFLISLKKEKKLLVLLSFSFIVGAIADYIAVLMGWGITGIALTTGVLFFLINSSLVLYAMSQYQTDALKNLKFLISSLLPYGYIVSVLFVIERFVPLQLTGNISRDVVGLSLQLALLGLASIPIIYKIKTELAT